MNIGDEVYLILSDDYLAVIERFSWLGDNANFLVQLRKLRENGKDLIPGTILTVNSTSTNPRERYYTINCPGVAEDIDVNGMDIVKRYDS